NVSPGTNGPFWSLSYEFWYYIIFAAGVYFTGKKKIAGVTCVALIAGPKILVGLPIWLMGAGVYFAVVGKRASTKIGWICWLGSFAAGSAFLAFDMGQILAEAFPKI